MNHHFDTKIEILKLANRVKEISLHSIQLKIRKIDRRVPIHSINQSLYYLVNNGCLRRIGFGIYEITQEGIARLQGNGGRAEEKENRYKLMTSFFIKQEKTFMRVSEIKTKLKQSGMDIPGGAVADLLSDMKKLKILRNHRNDKKSFLYGLK